MVQGRSWGSGGGEHGFSTGAARSMLATHLSMLCVVCLSVLLNLGPKMRSRQLLDNFKKDISGRETVVLKTLKSERV